MVTMTCPILHSHLGVGWEPVAPPPISHFWGKRDKTIVTIVTPMQKTLKNKAFKG
jgi:hypothetical protein